MAIERGDAQTRDGDELTDSELLALFRTHPEKAWPRFIDRHTDTILRQIRRLGFSEDDTMDRFVYVCEKLAEDRCRRLRGVKFAGREGDLGPWLHTVVERLTVSWAWSTVGRRRLLRPIERLGRLEQRVFTLHFWQGLSPMAIAERLKAEHARAELPDVFDALASVIDALSPNKLWRLVAERARSSTPAPIAGPGNGPDGAVEPAAHGEDAESALLRAESETRLDLALRGLASRERLILQLRFEDALTFKAIGDLLGLSPRATRNAADRAIRQLRQRLEADGSELDAGPSAEREPSTRPERGEAGQRARRPGSRRNDRG